MADIVASTPTEVVEKTNLGGLILNIAIVLFFLGVAYVIYKAIKDRKTELKELDKYETTYDMVRQLALQNSNDKYFRSWWRPSKNATIYRMFEWKETGKIALEPLIGLSCKYMGHYEDTSGNYQIAFCASKDFFILPVVEVIDVPSELVHLQDDSIVINCVSVDRKTPVTPYYPVINMADGKVCNAGFTFLQKFYDEKVSADVIKTNTNDFMNTMHKVTKYNPSVQHRRATRGTDGGA